MKTLIFLSLWLAICYSLDIVPPSHQPWKPSQRCLQILQARFGNDNGYLRKGPPYGFSYNCTGIYIKVTTVRKWFELNATCSRKHTFFDQRDNRTAILKFKQKTFPECGPSFKIPLVNPGETMEGAINTVILNGGVNSGPNGGATPVLPGTRIIPLTNGAPAAQLLLPQIPQGAGQTGSKQGLSFIFVPQPGVGTMGVRGPGH